MPETSPRRTEQPRPVLLRSGVSGSATVGTVQVDDRLVVRCSVHALDHVAPLTEASAASIATACELALEKRMPLILVLSSSGAAVADGIGAIDGWGRAARGLVRCSGTVPVIIIVAGPAVSGAALLLGIADHVIMVEEAYAFVSGPNMVTEFTGVPIEASRLGGSGMHDATSGLTTALAPDLDAAHEQVADLLSFLPDHNGDAPPLLPSSGSGPDERFDIDTIVPTAATGSYDVRDVIHAVVDDGYFLEVRAAWAGNLVTGFASIDGQSIGIVANQPQVLAGTLNVAASQKGARFVAFCDAFNVPLLTFVDTPGFQPGKDLEWRGMIRHGAQLAFAYARATVPRVSMTLRKSYGGAYIVMDSKRMGNDLAYAWPTAEIAVMGAKGAVEILHRKADEGERRELEVEYEERLLNPYRAAERGSIDAVIAPSDTRHELIAAFGALRTKRETLPVRRHDNTPL